MFVSGLGLCAPFKWYPFHAFKSEVWGLKQTLKSAKAQTKEMSHRKEICM